MDSRNGAADDRGHRPVQAARHLGFAKTCCVVSGGRTLPVGHRRLRSRPDAIRPERATVEVPAVRADLEARYRARDGPRRPLVRRLASRRPARFADPCRRRPGRRGSAGNRGCVAAPPRGQAACHRALLLGGRPPAPRHRHRVPLLAALYTIGTRGSWRRAAAAWGVTTVSYVPAVYYNFVARGDTSTGPSGLGGAAVLAAGVAWRRLLGRRPARASRFACRPQRRPGARTRSAQRERELLAREAIAMERARIARELHDVVAHHVSVMVIQAGAAEATLPAGAEQTRATLQAVREAGREALVEMRQLLGVLREPTSDGRLRGADRGQIRSRTPASLNPAWRRYRSWWRGSGKPAWPRPSSTRVERAAFRRCRRLRLSRGPGGSHQHGPPRRPRSRRSRRDRL